MDRDLSSHDLWEESLARSRRRREAAASAKGFELPARGLSVAALVAVTGGTVVSVGAASVIGGDDDGSGGGSGKGARPAAVAKAPERGAQADAASAPSGVSASAASSATSTAGGGSAAPGSGSQSAQFAASDATTGEPTLEERAVAASRGVPVAKIAAANDAAQQGTPGQAAVAESTALQAGGTEQPSAPEQPAAGAPGDSAADQDAPAGDDAGGAPDTPAGDGSGAGQDAPADGPGAPERAGGVAELQRKLGLAPDGDFGPKTQRALKQWQREHGLEADGVAGPATRDALGIGAGEVLKRDAPPKPRAGGGGGDEQAPRQQRSGGGVRELQRALGIGVDGVFGPGTEQALEQWQRAHGLEADGMAGPATREALGIGSGKVLKRRGGGSGGGSGSGSDGGSSAISGVIAAANRIATAPYVYGGGHGSFEASGYDCSGSVSYALHGGGLLDSPLDSSGLMSYGLAGPGKHITIYANAGHAYMVVDGRRFDTSARSESGSRWSSTQRSSSGYVVRHPRGL